MIICINLIIHPKLNSLTSSCYVASSKRNHSPLPAEMKYCLQSSGGNIHFFRPISPCLQPNITLIFSLISSVFLSFSSFSCLTSPVPRMTSLIHSRDLTFQLFCSSPLFCLTSKCLVLFMVKVFMV